MTDTKGKLSDIFRAVSWVTKLLFQFSPGLFIAVFITQIVTSIAPFIRTKILSQLIDSITGQSQADWVQSFIVFMVVGLVTSLFFFLQGQLNRVLDIKLQAYLRKIFIAKVANLDYQHLESKETSALIAKVDEEFGWRTRATVSDLSNLLFGFMSLAAITIIILPKYPYLWLLMMVFQIPQYLVERYWVKKDWRNYDANSDKTKELWDLNYQLRQKNYIAELRINNATNYLVAKFNSLFDFIAGQRVSVAVAKTPSEVVLSVLSIIISGISLFVIIQDVRLGILTIGAFTFYFDTMRRVGEVFQSLVFNTVSITENSFHIDNFRQVMEMENIVRGGSKKISGSRPPLIEFRHVSFKYPGTKRYVFTDLNLTINSSEEIAIVGENGAGKSTLIKLICCFYHPTSGEILIGGIDSRLLDLNNWYKHLAYLTQEFNNFGNLTLGENVSIGNPTVKAKETAILSALNHADATFWKKYQNGLSTRLSRRYGGEEPSWGQWQKISIARIFYRQSSVMILDEPTASIDAVSEFKIFNELYRSVKNKTLIIVSHRFSTVRNAKRILVLDNGKIVEQGSHSDLLAKDGIYAKSFALQAKGYN